MAQTLEEVAKLAGVSRSTVSRVINDQPSVRDEVRERVWRVIRAQNYQPHQAARALVTRRTNVIGLIIPETVARLFTDPFFAQLIQGIAEVCNQRGYYLMLSLMMARMDRDAFYRRILHSGQLDGVLVASAPLDDPLIPRLEESVCPCVLVGRNPDHPNIPWVDVDNVTGARNLTEYLIGLGHRRVATITGPLNTIVGRERFEGYRQALAQAEIAYDDALVAAGDFTEDSGFRAMERLLHARPTAVFAASDAMSAGAMQALAQAGLRVPADVSVAGYDDAPIASLLDPPLTTVRQSAVELGKVAAETLIRLLENPDVPMPLQKLSTSLVIRDSTRQL
ncbi:MAG: LacI family transcriptional regulator [Chloroflexi bacterium]|nr:LacI family transcriptional regulator [Chloroflexota bacterium]MBU1748328.1 LacI family transcriptional regulator [Chloroflexota bacterium]